MVLPVSPKMSLGNNCSMLTSKKNKYIQPTNISENILLSNKYGLTRSTKNLFKNAAYHLIT